jgi:hypothetical protein
MRLFERCAFALLSLVTPPADRDALLGDLLEEHALHGGMAREALRAIPAMCTLRAQRAGGLRALGFGAACGALAAAALLLAIRGVWLEILFHVPKRAAADVPLSWWLVGVGPAIVAGLAAARSGLRLASTVLGEKP